MRSLMSLLAFEQRLPDKVCKNTALQLGNKYSDFEFCPQVGAMHYLD